MNDGAEAASGTDPLNGDREVDGVPDSAEVATGTDLIDFANPDGQEELEAMIDLSIVHLQSLLP